MADFDIPGYNIVDGISPSPFNFPEPRKRPFSSMSPAILTDDDGNVQLIIGASGGKRITTAVSQVSDQQNHSITPQRANILFTPTLTMVAVAFQALD